MMELERLYEAVLTGRLDVAKAVTSEAVAASIDPYVVINDYMARAMADIGLRFEEGTAFVPELLMAARAMKGALALLKPLMQGTATRSLGKVVIGTVKGDLHDIGKNLVASMLEGCGFEVVNLGADISKERFVKALQESGARILCLSALLTTTMNYMQEVIQALEVAGLRDRVKVMVGGAPVTDAFARQIGADGYSDNAHAAVALAKSLVAA